MEKVASGYQLSLRMVLKKYFKVDGELNCFGMKQPISPLYKSIYRNCKLFNRRIQMCSVLPTQAVQIKRVTSKHMIYQCSGKWQYYVSI